MGGEKPVHAQRMQRLTMNMLAEAGLLSAGMFTTRPAARAILASAPASARAGR